MIKDLSQKASELLSVKPGDLLNQLIAVAPVDAAHRLTLMKSSPAEKIDYLKRHLAADLTETEFFNNTGGKYARDAFRSGPAAIKLVETLFQAEKDLASLSAVLIIGESLDRSAGIGQLLRITEIIDDQKFYEISQTSSEGIFNEILNNGPIATLASASFNKQIQKMTNGSNRKIMIEAAAFQLVEQPREVGIMRSAPAGDCTHTCSFAKADDPNERIFFVNDVETRRDLGFVATEIKHSELGDVLYLTAINGQSITRQQAGQILQMLYLSREQLGVKEIAITHRNLELHMNYADVIHFLEEQNAGKPVLRLESKNPAISNIIDGYLKVEYQKQYENTEGVVYHPGTDALKTKISFTTRPNDEIFTHSLDPRRVLLFALELDSTERWLPEAGAVDEGERAIIAAKMDLNEYRIIRRVLQNHDHLSTEIYKKRSKEALAKRGWDVDKEFLHDYPHLFYDGQLAASDAVEPALRKATLRLASQIIKRGMWHATWGLKEFGRDPKNLEVINQSKELEGVFAWMKTDLNFHSIQLANMVSAGIGFPTIRETEFTRDLMRMVIHGWGWGPNIALDVLKAVYPASDEHALARFLKDTDQGVREGAQKLDALHVAERASLQRAAQADRSSGQNPIDCDFIYAH